MFGRVLIEAMACGIPVVATNSGGIPLVVGDAGVLVEPGSVSALATALQSLVSEPDQWEALKAKGRKRMIGLYDTRIVADQLAESILGLK